IDLESKPIEAPSSVEPFLNSKPFSGHDTPVGTEESLPAQTVPNVAPESPPALSPPIIPYRRHGIVQGPRKTVRPQPPLSSPPPKRCRVLHAPALPESALSSVPIELLPPRKRFTASERIENLEKEVTSREIISIEILGKLGWSLDLRGLNTPCTAG
nr:hypothetical protein [Tanacetum cinerariifolium]